MIDALTALGYDNDQLEALHEHIGYADTVTAEQLAAADVANCVVLDLYRRLQPRERPAVAEVCDWGPFHIVYTPVCDARWKSVYLVLNLRQACRKERCV